MKILEGECVGCGNCYDLCPQGAIKVRPRTNDKAYSVFYIDSELCTNCGTCSPDVFDDCLGEAIQEDDYKPEED